MAAPSPLTRPAGLDAAPFTPTQPPSAAELLSALSSPAPLTRDRALLSVPHLPPAGLAELGAGLLPRLSTAGPWEPTAAALQAASAVLGAPGTAAAAGERLARAVLPRTLPLITHAEARVRAATAALVGVVARVLGVVVWDEASGELLGGVERNFGLDDEQRLREADRVAKKDLADAETAPKDRGLRMVHETEGWRGLETSLLAIGQVLAGCGAELLKRDEDAGGVQTVLDYIARAKTHPNRFVREAGLRLLANVVDACVDAGATKVLKDVTSQLLEVVSSGLQDNWSQVRYCASVVVRKMLAGLSQEARREFYPVLLPRMCLNRHYVAEGVRVYSHETWKTVVGADGRVYLVKLLGDVVAFYESQCNADNHAVREAACQSLAEVTTRLQADAVRPCVPRIVNALIECFKDESWPVRDHACTALADVTAHFAGEVESTGRLRELFDLFHAHLADNIVSVRQNTAVSIVKASRAFPAKHPVLGLERLGQCAEKLLPKVMSQREQKYEAPAKGSVAGGRRDRPTGYGAAAKLARDNDVDLHTGQVMYSCGSLAPKLRRGGGCMDHGFSRAMEPWEETDGGVRLWARVAEAGKEGSVLAGLLLPRVVDALKVVVQREFAHAGQAQESFWQCVADAAGLIPRACWTPALVAEAAALAETSSKGDHDRASTAAKRAVMSMRRAVGFDAYHGRA